MQVLQRRHLEFQTLLQKLSLNWQKSVLQFLVGQIKFSLAAITSARIHSAVPQIEFKIIISTFERIVEPWSDNQ